MSLWDDIVGGISSFGRNVGNATANTVQHPAQSIFNAADFVRRDIAQPIARPLQQTAADISDLIGGTTKFSDRQALQDTYNKQHEDLPLLSSALSAPSNLLGKGIIDPAFKGGWNATLAAEMAKNGDWGNAGEHALSGGGEIGNAIFHATNPEFATQFDTISGGLDAALHGGSQTDVVKGMLDNVGGAAGKDVGQAVFGDKHPILALATDIVSMKGMEDPEALVNDVKQIATHPGLFAQDKLTSMVGGVKDSLSKLPLLGKHFTVADAKTAEAAAVTAHNMGVHAGLTDAEDTGTKLIGVHNMSPDKFGASVDQGQLLAPSMAVINAEHNFDQFGRPPIQAVLDQSHIDPSLPETRAYGYDAFSPVVPKGTYAGLAKFDEQTTGDLLENHIPVHLLNENTPATELRSHLQDSNMPEAEQERIMQKVYGDKQLVIKGKDGSEQHLPLTTENIKKEMQSRVENNGGDIRGTETIGGHAPVATYAAPEFKNLQEMKDYGPHLKTTQELENTPQNPEASKVHDYLQDIGKKSGQNLPNYHPFKSPTVRLGFLKQIIRDSKEATPESVKAAMEHLNIPNKEKIMENIDYPKLNKLLDPLRNPDTDYFEAKRFDSIPWKNVPGLVIPKYEQLVKHFDMTPEEVQQLKNSVDKAVAQNPNLKVVEYDATDPNGQAKARSANFPQQMFGGLAGVQVTTDKNGKKHISFNPGLGAAGLLGMSLAGHLTNPGEEVGALPKTIDPHEYMLQKIAEEKAAMEQEHVNYLKSNSTQGTTSPQMVHNEATNETTFNKGYSNNEPWYQKFYQQNGKAPNEADLQAMAKDHLLNGFASKDGNIPANEQYTALHGLEGATKEDQAAAATSGTTAEPMQARSFGNSVREADNALSPDVRKQAGGYYDVQHNPETVAKAQANIANDPAAAHEFVMGDSPASAEKSATGIGLMQHYDQTGEVGKAVEVAGKMAEEATKQGQAIQALSIIDKLSPEGILTYAQRELGKVNADLPENKQVKLTDTQAQALTDQAKAIKAMPEGKEKVLATAKMLTDVADLEPKNLGKKLSSLQSMALLLNPKTLVDKIGIGHTAFGLGDALVTKGVGGVLDKGLSLLTGKRTTALPDIPLMAREYGAGIAGKFSEAKAGVNIHGGGTYDDPEVMGHAFSSGPMKKIEDYSSAIIGAIPAGVNRATFADSLAGQMKLAKVTEPTEDMITRATLDAKYSTLMNDSMISKSLGQIKKGLNVMGFDGFGAGDAILKFAHVPANLISAGLDYSPVGVVKTVFQLAKDAKTGKGFDQAQFVRNASRAGVGTAAMLGVNAALANLGIISGKMDDKKSAQDFEKTTGMADYQLNTSALMRWAMGGFKPEDAKPQNGDKMVTYNWLEPAGQNIAAGAALAKDKGGNLLSDLGNSTLDSVNAATDSSMFYGLQTLFNTNDPKTGQPSMTAGFKKAMEGLPASFVPTIANEARNLTDNAQRNVGVNKGDPAYQPILNQIENKLPLLSQKLPPKVDVAGNIKKVNPDGNSWQNVFLNPSVTQHLNTTPIGQELLRLYQTNDQTTQFPTTVSSNAKVNGQDYPISTTNQAQIQHYVGAMANQILPTLLNSSAYQKATDAKKASLISGTLTDIMTVGKQNILHLPTPAPTPSTSTKPKTLKLPTHRTVISRKDKIKAMPQPSALPLLSK